MVVVAVRSELHIVSVGFRKTEHFLGDERKNELLGDRRDAGKRHFAQQALDMISFAYPNPPCVSTAVRQAS